MNEGDDDEGVGYQRPPRHSRFQKGRSGNPGGRPKGSRSADVSKTLNRKVSIVVDGRRERVPLTDAVALQLTKQALAGNVHASKEVMRLAALQAEAKARMPSPKAKRPSKIALVVIDPKDCSPSLEKLGVVANINGQFKIEPWVIEAAFDRDPGLRNRLTESDWGLLRGYTRKDNDKVGDPGTELDWGRKRRG